MTTHPLRPAAPPRQPAYALLLVALLWVGSVVVLAFGPGPLGAPVGGAATDGERPRGTVEGVVTRDGEPLGEVEVVFLPDPEKGNFGPHAAAYTDAAGRYRLRCEALDADGAVVGPHRVIVRDIAALPDPPGAPRGPRAKAGRAEGVARTLGVHPAGGAAVPRHRSPAGAPDAGFRTGGPVTA
jgi:hypothetical protein